MTDASDDWGTVAESQFVSLGTYRKTGERVDVAVWIAPDGDELVVTSERATGKIKRLRRDPRVLLRPCTRFGAVADDAVAIAGVAVSLEPAAGDRAAAAALGRKYGWQFATILRFERLVRRLQRRDGERVIIRIRRP